MVRLPFLVCVAVAVYCFPFVHLKRSFQKGRGVFLILEQWKDLRAYVF